MLPEAPDGVAVGLLRTRPVRRVPSLKRYGADREHPIEPLAPSLQDLSVDRCRPSSARGVQQGAERLEAVGLLGEPELAADLPFKPTVLPRGGGA